VSIVSCLKVIDGVVNGRLFIYTGYTIKETSSSLPHFFGKFNYPTGFWFTKILKKDCGCTRRKKTLNKKFKFK
jgi:hypothetical protein